jgi:hypothetical protein
MVLRQMAARASNLIDSPIIIAEQDQVLDPSQPKPPIERLPPLFAITTTFQLFCRVK